MGLSLREVPPDRPGMGDRRGRRARAAIERAGRRGEDRDGQHGPGPGPGAGGRGGGGGPRRQRRCPAVGRAEGGRGPPTAGRPARRGRLPAPGGAGADRQSPGGGVRSLNMDLEHSFTIPVPPEQAWQVLLDVEQIAPCMPGATVESVDGDVVTGRIKVKVGPVTMTYAGTGRFVERDEQARTVMLEASGKETRGAGTASATIRSGLHDEGGQTKVGVHTTMTVPGRPAQFGRGVMAEGGGGIIEKFAANLAAQLAGGGSPAAASPPAAAGAAPGGGTPSNPEVTADGAVPLE